jgi:hypothetical protein
MFVGALAVGVALATGGSTAAANVLPASHSISKVKLRPFQVKAAPLTASALIPGHPPVTQLIVASAPRGDGPRRVTLRFTDVIDKEQGCVPPELEYDPQCTPEGELSQQLTLIVRRTDPDGSGHCAVASDTAGRLLLTPTTLADARLRQVDATPDRQWVHGGQTICLTLAVWLPDLPNNNVVQSDGTSFRVSITSTDTDSHDSDDSHRRGADNRDR